MAAAMPSSIPVPLEHATFLGELPRIDAVLRSRLRRLPRHCRDEAVADALGAAWHAWAGLLRRGLDSLEIGPCGIAANAARSAARGRRLGCGRPGRATDVYHPRARASVGVRLVGLDEGDGGQGWRGLAAPGRGYTPADAACFRLDFEAWLGGLPLRKRRVAGLLAEGHTTGSAARVLGVTQGAISQARAWLAASWRAFQGEDHARATIPGSIRHTRG
jgi:hypothetical protein